MKLVPLLKKLAGLAVFAFMGWGLWKLHEKLGEQLASTDWRLVMVAAVVAAIYLIANASVWSVILRVLGEKVPRWAAASLWVRCESMRWLPGGIWGYASRVVEAKQLGVAKKGAGLSLGIELVVTVASWLAIAAVGLAFSPELWGVAPEFIARLGVPRWVVGVGAVCGAIAVAVASLLFWARIQKTGSGAFEMMKDRAAVVRAFFEYTALNLFYCLGFVLCIRAVGIDPMPAFPAIAAAYAVAWLGGFVAFGAPGGMGVREGLLFLIFSPAGVGEEVAIAAILWRAVQVVVELLWLGVCQVAVATRTNEVVEVSSPSLEDRA